MTDLRYRGRFVHEDEFGWVRNPGFGFSGDGAVDGFEGVGMAHAADEAFVLFVAETAGGPALGEESGCGMFAAVFADFALVFGATEGIGFTDVFEEAAFAGEGVIGGEAAGEGIEPAGDHGHAGAVVVPIHFHGEADLAKVIEALSFLRAHFALGEGGKEEAGEDADDGDDDEEFDEGEGRAPIAMKMGANDSRGLQLFHNAQ